MPAGKPPPPKPASATTPPAGAGGGRRVLVGRFGAAHGVRGELRLHSFTEDPVAIEKLFPLTDANGAATFALAGVRHVRDAMFVVRIAGVADRNQAETLRNVDLFADRARFPPLGEEEYYAADLVGLPAFDVSGARLGIVVDLVNYGAGDILEVRPESGDTLLIPFTRAAVPVIDLAAGRVVIAPPAEIEAKPPLDEGE